MVCVPCFFRIARFLLSVKGCVNPINFAVAESFGDETKFLRTAPEPRHPPRGVCDGDCYVGVTDLLSQVYAVSYSALDWYLVRAGPVERLVAHTAVRLVGRELMKANLPVRLR